MVQAVEEVNQWPELGNPTLSYRILDSCSDVTPSLVKTPVFHEEGQWKMSGPEKYENESQFTKSQFSDIYRNIHISTSGKYISNDNVGVLVDTIIKKLTNKQAVNPQVMIAVCMIQSTTPHLS